MAVDEQGRTEYTVTLNVKSKDHPSDFLWTDACLNREEPDYDDVVFIHAEEVEE